MNDSLNLSGHISWVLFDKNENVISCGNVNNVITNYGKQWAAGVLSGSTNSMWLGAGTSIGPTATVSANDTQLFSEIPSSGYGYTRASMSKTAVNNTIEYSSYIAGITSSTTIREVGLFSNSSVGGTYLVAHQLVGQIPVGPTYGGLQVTWIISLN